jgi:gluconokinase
MDVLCFDIGSGGIRAARFDETLEPSGLAEVAWSLHRDAHGRATLSADDITSGIEQLARQSHDSPLAAVSIGCFMHSFLVLSSCCAPLTPVHTWLDTTSAEGLDVIRRRIGEPFHRQTGCQYHPMFPVFKLAANTAGRGNRVASPKALLAQEFTGTLADDFGMASASGLLDLHSGKWHSEILDAVGLEPADLPQLSNPYATVRTVTEAGNAKFGIPAGTPLVNGSGDGFLANVGSGCVTPRRMAVTLGTSGVARQMVPAPALDPNAGTFCYRATSEAFLLGCASSNGGNVLDWARNVFGPVGPSNSDIPLFLPWLYGERSIEWNPNLRASWDGVTSQHTSIELSRSVAEGVIFNLAQYVEVIQQQSGVRAEQIVLSGNGFQDSSLASILAALVPAEVLLPTTSGLATLRGAAVYAWRALGHDALPAIERLLDSAKRVVPDADKRLAERFEKFKRLRGKRGQTTHSPIRNE